MAGPLEREVKLRFGSRQDALDAVSRLAARPLQPRRLQADVVLDTPDRKLAAQSQVLRVRIDAHQHAVTFKSPVPHATIKVREEIETMVGDGRQVLSILLRLGFEVAFRYEKYREEFALDEVVIAIDETPIGTFIEIEGSDTAIMRTAHALGRTSADFILDSYCALFVQACAAEGLVATDMIFAEKAG